MNDLHLQLLASDDWRRFLDETVLPFALGGRPVTDLGDDVVEVGPGPGLTTDLLRAELARLTVVELDRSLAAALEERLAGTNVDVVAADATAMPFDDGRFSGAASFTMLHHVPTVELQDRLLAEVARVLRSGGLFVASDGVASDDLAALHEGDVYNPLDPATLGDRLGEAGFVDVEVQSNEFAWRCHARRA